MTTAETPPLSEGFYKHAWQTAMLYLLLTIPTVLLMRHCALSGDSVSVAITQSWKAVFWQIPGLSQKASRVIADIGVILVALGSAWFYIQGYQLLKQIDHSSEATVQRQVLNPILLWSTIFALILGFVVPFHSMDIYGYINRGAQQAFYAVNPYAVTVSQIPNWQIDPIFHKHWITNPCPYGFFFTHLANALTAFSGREFWSAFLLFKDLSILTHLGIVWMLFHTARLFGMEKPWLPAYLYGWNPLILLHLIANGHNDGLLALCLLCAIWLAVSNRHAWAALPMLTLSILTKYASLLAAPFFILYFIKQRQWKTLAFGLMYSVMLLVILGWSFLQDPAALPVDKMTSNAAMSQHSLHSALARSVYWAGSLFMDNADGLLNWARVWFKWMLWGGYAFIYGWLVVSFARDSQIKDKTHWPMLYGMALSITLMIVFASAKFNAWYIGMFLPLLLILHPQSRLRQFGLLLTLFQLLSFSPVENLHIGSFILLTLTPLILTRYVPLFREET